MKCGRCLGMRSSIPFVVLFVFGLHPVLLASASDSVSKQLPSAVGRQVDQFALQDFRGKEHRWEDYAGSRLIVAAFLGTECPLVKLYGPRLEALSAEYASHDVVVIGFNSNQQDSLTEIGAFVRRHGISFPILKDPAGRVAEQFGASRTPEVFILDQTRTIRYQGRIDDQYGVGYSRNQPERQDLRESLEDLLAGRPVRTPHTEAVGCLIGRARAPNEESTVTYANQISRLLQLHCVECHRPGEIAPFELTSYEEVVGWADMIEEVVRQQRMPPWHADPEHGNFANARLIPEADKELIYEWVRQGAPLGDPHELPSPREFVTGWRLPRDPDLVVAMRDEPFSVPAEGVVEYQYFAVDPGFEEDKWVAAADVVPGERSVVHHVIVFISPPEGRHQRGLGLLAAYVPGQSALELPGGQARLVPAGSKLIFQMHYTPIGSEQLDMTKIGLVFADPESVSEEVVSLISLNEEFEIPPHAENYRVDSSRGDWPENARLLSMAPHMHLRGKSFRFDGVWPDGRREILCDVANYDFNWQNSYQLATPFAIPVDFTMQCIAHYDNSAKNLANPDPSASVRWGDQTWNEMMIAFFDVAVPKGSWEKRRSRPSKKLTEQDEEQARQVARDLIARFDANGDGQLERSEAPNSFAAFAFWQYDADGNKVITEQEAYEEALRTARRG